MRWTSALSVATVAFFSTVVQGAPEYRLQNDNYYNYIERVTPGTESGLKTAVKIFYEQMLREHASYPDHPQPMMAAGMVLKGEYWFATSGSYKKGPKLTSAYPNNFPGTLKLALDKCYQEYGAHKKQSNCAEVRLLALYFEISGEQGFPPQIPLAVYGKGGVSQEVGYHHPCSEEGNQSGCESVVVRSFSMNALTRRNVVVGNDVPIESGGDIPKTAKKATKSHSRDIKFATEN